MRLSPCCLRPILLLGALFYGIYGDQVLSAGITKGQTYYIPPSQLTREVIVTQLHGFKCYDYRDHNRLLNCRFTRAVIGLIGDGGHNHDPLTHPLIYPVGSSVGFNGIDLDDSPLGVEGYTNNDVAIVRHSMPEVAGEIQIESYIYSPPRWVCVTDCYTTTSHRYLDTLDVGLLDDLVELPSNPDIYIRCPFTSTCTQDGPGVDTRHPRMFYGKPGLVDRLITMAAYYRNYIPQDVTQTLRISDMNLPRGGLFDIRKENGTFVPYKPPHKTHRRGTSADISFRALDGNESFVDNEVDQKLIREAILFAGLRRIDEGENECTAENAKKCIHVEFSE